ncbi:MAG: hypothetical protein NC483_06985 [Ruminococcus sp.]|nr:hypothetical protein [Ruminococcus sp.]
MNDETRKKPKKKFKFRFIVGGLAIIAAGLWIFNSKTGKIEKLIDKYFNYNDKPQDEITAIAEGLPLDEDGIISITFPVVDRNLDDPQGLYSLPIGYTPYYVDTEEASAGLSKVTDSSKNGENVDNYQSNSGTVPSGYVGVVDKYAAFLAQVEAIKANLFANGNGDSTIALTKIEYEVPNLYYLASGYDLYSDDPSVMDTVKLAYVLEDGSRIYSIPANMVDKLIGVKKEICEVIVKYDELRGQITEMYTVYTSEGKTNETANRGR